MKALGAAIGGVLALSIVLIIDHLAHSDTAIGGGRATLFTVALGALGALIGKAAER